MDAAFKITTHENASYPPRVSCSVLCQAHDVIIYSFFCRFIYCAESTSQSRSAFQNKTTAALQNTDYSAVPPLNMRRQPLPYGYKFDSVPDYQHDGCKSSQVSSDSQCSSGYHSDSSSLSNSCHDDFLSSSEAPLYPKGTYKSLKTKEEKRSTKSTREDNRSTPTAVSEIKHPRNCYYNTSNSFHDQYYFTHCPSYCTTVSNISHASSFSSKLSPSPTNKAHTRQYDSAIQQSLTFESPSPILEKPNRFVFISLSVRMYAV